jgi:hypothetical protein
MADPLAGSIEQGVVHSPAIHAHAVNATFRFTGRFRETLQDFLPQAVYLPHQVVVHLPRPVGKAMDLLQSPLAAIPATEHQTAAFRAKINRHYISSVVHRRNASEVM